MSTLRAHAAEEALTEVELFVVGADGRSRAVHLDGSAAIGRAPDNELVVTDPEVSWRHAVFYQDRGAVLVRDHGSRNGTFVDGVRITEPTRLTDRSRVRIGPVSLFVRGASRRTPPALVVEECGSGVQHPLRSERFAIGPGADAHLKVPDAPRSMVLLIHEDGEVWLGEGDDDRPLELGEQVVLGRLTFRVVEADPTRVPTVEGGGDLYPYQLRASLDGATGPQASILHLGTGAKAVWEAETRAVLVFLLGRQLHQDRQAGRRPADEGWFADDELITAVWGRTPRSEGVARLKTLVHRVRSDMRAAGLDPWCLEKRRGYTRIRVREAVL